MNVRVAAIRRYQAACVRKLIDHAYRTVPFYRRRFDEAGIHPSQIRDVSDLARIPTTRKIELREASEADVVSTRVDPSRLIRHWTGGSTGEPMAVRLTRREEMLQRGIRLHAMLRMGLRPTDRRAVVSFWNHPQHTSPLERLGLMCCRAVSAYRPADQIIADLRALRPDVIRGHPSLLSDIADTLTAADRRSIRPRFVTTDSEQMTAVARARIERGFQAPAHDFYDCWECNLIAVQCVKTRLYHVMDHAVLVEVLVDGRPAKPGEVGEVAVTALHSFASPFIRYLIGDMVERGPETCPCGTAHSCVTRVHGRTADLFHLPDGRRVHPNVLVRFLYGLGRMVRRFQIVQESVDRIAVRLQVEAGPVNRDRLESMRAAMTQELGSNVLIRVDLVERLDAEPNGKFRCYFSHVSPGHNISAPIVVAGAQ